MATTVKNQYTPADIELDRSENLALDVPLEEAPGADEVDAAALSVAVIADGTLSSDGRFRWSAGWHQWVPTGREDVVDIGPIDLGGLFLEQLEKHPEGCWCDDCFNMGQYMADYLKNRGLWSNGGLK